MAELYILEFPNGKGYVGITSRTSEKRFWDHKTNAKANSQYAVHRAIRKYGAPKLIPVMSGSLDEMKEYEIELIEELGTLVPGGYNMTAGGDGTVGYKFTDAQKRRLSDAHKGYEMPQSQRDAIAAGNTGNVRGPRSEETKQKLRDALTGRPLPESTRQKMSKARKGKPWTEARRAAYERTKNV